MGMRARVSPSGENVASRRASRSEMSSDESRLFGLLLADSPELRELRRELMAASPSPPAYPCFPADLVDDLAKDRLDAESHSLVPTPSDRNERVQLTEQLDEREVPQRVTR